MALVDVLACRDPAGGPVYEAVPAGRGTEIVAARHRQFRHRRRARQVFFAILASIAL